MNNELNARLINAFEKITRGLTFINSDHSAIHKGWGAIASDYFTLANGASKTYCLTSSPENYPHFKNIVLNGLGGDVSIEIIRDATITLNTGTAITVANPNHNASQIPEMTIKESPTYSGGVSYPKTYALSDATRHSIGNASISTSENQELVFKTSEEQYILKVTNLTTSEITVAWSAFWYEEPLGKS